jgi:hypothetical protein
MRRFAALWAVALAACSDAGHSSAPLEPRLAAPPLHADSNSTTAHTDARSIPERLSHLVAMRFSQVSLPPDNFSLSSDAVHPDVACMPTAWNGARCWMMYTPYKGGLSLYENPGLLMLPSDTSWSTPPSIVNPIVPFPGGDSYNSDPDQAFEPGSKRLTQVYRVVADSFNKIMIMSTLNARTWTTPRLAFKERNHDAISPSLVIDHDRSANLWYIRSGADGCTSTSSSVVLRTAMPDSDQRIDQAAWSPAIPVKLAIPNSVVWHLDVASLGPDAGYVALVVAYAKGATCGASDLWLATSDDGVNWKTFAMPLFWRGMSVATERRMSTWYRGTLRYDEATDSLHVWPSGLAGTSWTIYHTAFKLHDALNLLATAQPSEIKALFALQAPIRSMLPMP